MNRATAVNDGQKRLRGKNLALMGALVALIALLFFVTIARLGAML